MVRNAQLYCVLKNLEDPHPPHKPAAFLFYPLHKFQQPAFVVDTSKTFQRKLELMRIYASQFAESVGDFLFTLESRDRYFGSQIGARFGEALIADRPLRISGLDDVLSLLR
jgi:LmbE family N-acetylglucosaminyl deacetylase